MTPSAFTFLPPRGHRLRLELTVLMALLAVLVTLGVWRQSKESAVEKAHALFDLRVEELAHAVVLRAADYEQVLRGARGLFAANRSVGAREWHAYVQELNIGSLYMGMESFGVLRVIEAEDVERFVAERRRDPETADFTLKRAQPRERYVISSFIEPRLPRNVLVVGRDFASEPIRAAALARATDTEQPTATAPIQMFSMPDDASRSFAIFVPIFRPGLPLDTVEERRRAVWAYVSSAVRIETMIEGVLAGLQPIVATDALERMVFAITDVTDPTMPLPFYDRGLAKAERQPDGFSKKISVGVSGRQWMIEAVALPSLQARQAGDTPGIWTRAVALFGVLLTGLTHALGVILENRADLRRAYTQLAEREAELDLLAHSDPLTGVANRRHFFLVGTNEWARAKRHGRALSVLMIDVDHFKAINDTHGHGIGDETLKSLAAVCRTALRDCDLMARMGGEEFAVLLSEIDLTAAQAVAERLRQVAAEMRVATEEGGPLSLTISIGAACLCSDDESLDDVVRRADRALYAAKAAGRNQVIVSDQEELPLFALTALPDPSPE
jgi:diguanylate cyclase (GGDEF)-like protein